MSEPRHPIRQLSVDERMTWGNCPVCSATHGTRCNPDVGIALGRTVSGLPPTEGTHLARLQRAPFKVQEVPCD